MSAAYAELHCLSNFSFLRGASTPEELVQRAVELGYRALAITDECSVAGVVRAYQAAKKAGLKLIVGSEFTLDDGLKIILLALNRRGYAQLCRFITQGRRVADKGEYYLTRADIEAIGLSDCFALWLPQHRDGADDGCWLRGVFADRVRVGVEIHCSGLDSQILRRAVRLGEECNLSLLACGDVHMHRRDRRRLQDTLTAIRLNRPLRELGYALYPNGEHYLRPLSVLRRLYPRSLLAETVAVAESVQFSLSELRYEYPQEIVPSGYTPTGWLRELTYRGAAERYPQGLSDKIRNQLEHELRLISDLRYEPFFLTVFDVVNYARSQQILCQGRGSAANSAVCYCLGITSVDPAQMDLLFERFLSRERNEPPDIDVDFEHERREEVIQYVYRRYGRDRTAIAAAVITYQRRSAIRDVGKALGFSLDQIERFAEQLSYWEDDGDIEQRLIAAGFDPQHAQVQLWLHLVAQLQGFPRHLSQHTGGFVIAQSRLDELVPIENASMPDRTVIQWDKDDLESLGLLKVDVLALGMLTAVRKCFDLIHAYSGRQYTLATVPLEDKRTYRMIQKADTIGVFQIESRAQMSMLPRLKPGNFYDLVIQIAIVRPGPIQGDMVHPYLKRRDGREKVEYPSKALEAVLSRTLGIPIFQEQAMQIAVVAAGFTPGEADALRRAMAAWKRRGGLEPFEAKLKQGLYQNGYDTVFADRIFNQIKGFADYGFPESHSASFALLAYISAWLKCHEPAAFCCALLNSQPMGFYAPAQLIADAKRHDVEVRAVDVRCSDWDHTLETDTPDGRPAIRLGMRLVSGLKEKVAHRIQQQRNQASFFNIRDLAERCGCSAAELEALAAADALRGLEGHRRFAHWQVAGIETPTPLLQQPHFNEAQPLLRTMREHEEVVEDYRTLGLSARRHPLALLRPLLQQRRYTPADQLWRKHNGAVVRVAGVVTHRQRPGTAIGVIFVTLEDETGQVNLVVWPAIAKAQRQALLNSTLLLVTGVLQIESDVIHVVAGKLQNGAGHFHSLQATSRDFR